MATNVTTSVFSSVIETWKKFGIFDFVLPFLLVFAIMYGILERTNLFGEKTGKSVNAIIAFTIAMTTTLTGWFIGFLTGFLPWVSTLSVVIITGLMLVAIFAKDFEGLLSGERGKTVLIVGAIIVVFTLGAVLIYLGAPIWDAIGLNKLDSTLSAMGLSAADLGGIAFFIGFIVVLYMIGKGGEEKKTGE